MVHRRIRNTGLLLLINVVAFAIIFCAFEFIFRKSGIPFSGEWSPSENAIARFDPELGWSYMPGLSIEQTIGDSTWNIFTNEHGIRIPHSDHQLSSTAPSILFIGDSFVMGHGLNYEQTFVGRLAQDSALPYQMVNLGIQGFGTDQAYLQLRRHIKRFNTKAVVYVFLYLHIMRNGNHDRRMLVPNARFIGTKPLFGFDRDGDLILKRSPQLYEDYNNSYVLDFMTLRLGPVFSRFPPFPEELTARIVNEMASFCSASGAIFKTINWRWKESDYRKLFDEHDIDALDTIDGAPEGWADMIIPGDGHPNAKAGYHIADMVSEFFSNSGL